MLTQVVLSSRKATTGAKTGMSSLYSLHRIIATAVVIRRRSWRLMRDYLTACKCPSKHTHRIHQTHLRHFSLQFDPAPRAGEPLVSRRVPDYFLVRIYSILYASMKDRLHFVDSLTYFPYLSYLPHSEDAAPPIPRPATKMETKSDSSVYQL